MIFIYCANANLIEEIQLIVFNVFISFAPAGLALPLPEALQLISVKLVNMFNYFAILEMPQKFDQLDLFSVQNLWIAISQLN